MDIEYYCRAIFEGGFRQTVINDVLAKYRLHRDSKTASRGIAYAFRPEEVQIAQRYESYLSPEERTELKSEIGAQIKWFSILGVDVAAQSGQAAGCSVVDFSCRPQVA